MTGRSIETLRVWVAYADDVPDGYAKECTAHRQKSMENSEKGLLTKMMYFMHK